MKPIQSYRTMRWFDIKGDETLRLNHNLNKDSVVFDIGGYKGETTEMFFKKYGCNIYVFEPVKEFYEIIKKKFEDNSKIFVYNFGLGGKTEIQKISLGENSSSLFTHAQSKLEEIKIVAASEFIKENSIDSIDLMDVNIEGSEYGLIENLSKANLLDRIKNFQVQFHDFVDNSENEMYRLQSVLQKTHYLTYQYEYVWENWKLKDSNTKDVYSALNLFVDELKFSRKQYIDKTIECEKSIAELSTSINRLENEIEDKIKEINRYKMSKSYRLGYLLLHPTKFRLKR